MENKKFLNSNISKTRLSYMEKLKINKTIVGYLKESPKLTFSILYFFTIAIFIFLDYLTILNIFHFSSSKFLEIYLYSINISNTLFFLLITLVPFFIIAAMLLIDVWKDTKDSALTWNLFINNFYLSDNHAVFDINTSNYDNSKTEIQSCLKDKKIDSSQTKYLPISKEMKLYFKIQNEDITCVYAINKKFYKNQYNYILEDIGYIDTTKKGKHDETITRNKK